MNTQPQQVNRVTVFLTRSPGGIPSPNHKVVLRDLSSFQCMALLSGLFFKLYWEIAIQYDKYAQYDQYSKSHESGFPGGSEIKNPPANSGDVG